MPERALKHVLVVEDDDMVRDLVVLQLTQLGFRVSEATDGLTGLDIIRTRAHIDLLFTDIVMPGVMYGYDLAEAAEQLRPDLRILFTSGFNEDSNGHTIRLNHRNMLQKPYRRQDLARHLRRALE